MMPCAHRKALQPRNNRRRRVNQDIVASTAGGVYDFPMREYSPSQGRWWTPDPAGFAAVDPSNPQSWNRYAYVDGKPLNATDPLGLAAQQRCFDDGNCDWDPVGCTIDGMDVGCAEAQQQASMLGGGGIVACPTGGCPQSGEKFSAPGNRNPGGALYTLGLGANGWYFTAPNGEGFDDSQLWEELGLPDYNALYNGQPVDLAVTQWKMETATPAGPWVGPPELPGIAPREQPRLNQHSNSYAAFLACEYGEVMGDPHQATLTGLVNAAPLGALGAGNIPAAVRLLGIMGAYDIGGAWVVNTRCSNAVYGPGN